MCHRETRVSLALSFMGKENIKAAFPAPGLATAAEGSLTQEAMRWVVKPSLFLKGARTKIRPASCLLDLWDPDASVWSKDQDRIHSDLGRLRHCRGGGGGNRTCPASLWQPVTYP